MFCIFKRPDTGKFEFTNNYDPDDCDDMFTHDELEAIHNVESNTLLDDNGIVYVIEIENNKIVGLKEIADYSNKM